MGMKKGFVVHFLTLTLLMWAGATAAHADTFGTGANQFTIDFTTIENPGNAADTTGLGSVSYSYLISTYSISQNQIDAATSSGLQNVQAGVWSGNRPAANMSWQESAAFVNWLNTSKGFSPAYNLNWNGIAWNMSLWSPGDLGYDSNNLYRNSLAHYFLPCENEWYKAAYGKKDGTGYYQYTTGSNLPPANVVSGTNPNTAVFALGYLEDPSNPGPSSVTNAGGLSSYGTMGQGGNVYQWTEGKYGSTNPSDNRDVFGGAYFNGTYTLESGFYLSFSPDTESLGIGLRVAESVPELSPYAFLSIGAIGMLIVLRRKKTA